MNKPFLISLILSIILFLGLINILFLNNKPNTIPQIPKPKNNNSINIVFTTDKKYSPYLKVALKSLIHNKNKDSIYNIYILSIDLNKKTQKELKTFKQQNVEITTIPLKLSMLKGIIKNNVKYSYRVSNSDLFKFFIPEIFQNFDKILYLDSDILVLGDVSEIYDYDLDNKIIGVLPEKTNFKNEENSKYNCGVILFDIKKCSENNITKKLIQAKNNDKTNRYVTQLAYTKAIDIKNTKALPLSYNYLIKDEQTLDNKDKILIVHFAGFKKPWYNPDMEFASLWWQYAHLINPNWKTEKRNISACLKYAYLSLDKSKKMSKNIRFFKKKYNRCRLIK